MEENSEERFTKESANFQRRAMKIHRASGGNHQIVEEEIPLMRESELSLIDEDAILAGLDDLPDQGGRTGFSGFLQSKESVKKKPYNIRSESSQELDGDDLDVRSEGESPSSGHRPTPPQRATAFGSLVKQKVYIASQDCLATVYEDDGKTVTAKTASGKWIEIAKEDVEPVAKASTLPYSGKDRVYPNPERRVDDDGMQSPAPSRDRDESDTSMSSYAQRRRRGA